MLISGQYTQHRKGLMDALLAVPDGAVHAPRAGLVLHRGTRLVDGALDGDLFQFFSLNIADRLKEALPDGDRLPSMIFSGNLPSKLARISTRRSSMDMTGTALTKPPIMGALGRARPILVDGDLGGRQGEHLLLRAEIGEGLPKLRRRVRGIDDHDGILAESSVMLVAPNQGGIHHQDDVGRLHRRVHADGVVRKRLNTRTGARAVRPVFGKGLWLKACLAEDGSLPASWRR